MIEAYQPYFPSESDDDQQDIQVWEEPAVQPSPSKVHGRIDSAQWTAFRPGTAPEVSHPATKLAVKGVWIQVTVACGAERRPYGKQGGKDLSSPPTTLAETNFALKMAARSSCASQSFLSQ